MTPIADKKRFAFPLSTIPLLVWPLLAYHVVIMFGVPLNAPLLGIPLFSGAYLTPTAGDILIAAALILLAFEIMRSTKTHDRAIANHWASALTFVIALVEFIAWKSFGTPTFLIILLMTAMDFLAGFSIAIITVRRDIQVE